jgi:hypothetical protein
MNKLGKQEKVIYLLRLQNKLLQECERLGIIVSAGMHIDISDYFEQLSS